MKTKYLLIIVLSLCSFIPLLAQSSLEYQKFENKMQKRTETWLQSSGSGTGANGFIGEGEEPEGKNTFGTTSLADSLAYLVVLSLLYALGKKKGIYPYYCKKI